MRRLSIGRTFLQSVCLVVSVAGFTSWSGDGCWLFRNAIAQPTRPQSQVPTKRLEYNMGAVCVFVHFVYGLILPDLSVHPGTQRIS